MKEKERCPTCNQIIELNEYHALIYKRNELIRRLYREGKSIKDLCNIQFREDDDRYRESFIKYPKPFKLTLSRATIRQVIGNENMRVEDRSETYFKGRKERLIGIAKALDEGIMIAKISELYDISRGRLYQIKAKINRYRKYNPEYPYNII